MSIIVNPKQVYSYTKMMEDILLLTEAYPFLHKEVIGHSVEKRKIVAVKIGTGKKSIMLNGAHHAREWLTTALLMDMLEYYCHRHENEQEIRDIFSKISLWFVPMVNPDGVTLVQEGADSFPQKESLMEMNQGSSDFNGWKANIRGVDLNRQYPMDWDSIDDRIQKPASAMFKGSHPLTEPESMSLYLFALEHKFDAVACYHSSGEEIFWQYKLTGDLYHSAKKIVEQLAELTGYQLIDPGPNPSGGGFTDWFIMVQKRPSFTIEIAPYVGPVPVPLEYYDKIWQENKEVGITLAKACLQG
ncbi:peptidase M14 [Gracilibacillus oryzae]|uniref:Peptidase M14 n=1 Tax=Gracilibacillus oryzae TaxID=1672701 RepID=A0A7C8GSJ2_9BACI|nr:M14 family metallocarboxypeptidase [Gracilibacillus oryzae]KAB8131769.1 peptidase M14 [Gracilibacillus oryzae]